MRRGLACLFISTLNWACSGSAPLPARAIELNRSGAEALEEGDLETADARLNLALEYNPDFVEALVNQGLVELQRGNFDRAEQLLERARRIDPDVAQPHHGLGVLEERRNRPDRASLHYYEALAVDPGFAPSRANLARLLFAADLLEEALVQFKRWSELEPESASASSGLAETLLRLGRVAEADAIVQRAFERFEEEPAVVVLEARRRLRRGDVEGAVALLTPLGYGRDETAAAALGWLATAELLRREPRAAVAAADRALALEPDSSVATYAMAVALRQLGDPSATLWTQRSEGLAPGRGFGVARGPVSPKPR